MMKRLFLTLAVIAYSFGVCSAQIKAPVQYDTLVIRAMQYHFNEIRPENWPFKVVIRSATSFIFGEQEFKILDSNASYSEKEFTMEYGSGRKRLTLKEQGNTITLDFDGYLLTCFNPCVQAAGNGSGIGNNSTTSALQEGLETEISKTETIPFRMIEQKPSFQGGDANTFSKWVNSHLIYPETAKKNGVQGKVILQFTVYPDGTVRDVKVLRGVEASLDKEAVRVVSSSPKWTPGKSRNENVEVTYTFPVIFHL